MLSNAMPGMLRDDGGQVNTQRGFIDAVETFDT